MIGLSFSKQFMGVYMQQTLREKLFETGDFLLGVELLSIRGSMTEKSAVKARDFANDLVNCPAVDWISITDNAGGNPKLAPHALGKPILYAGKEVVIHMTCKDLNRNGLESQAWVLSSEGFHNILAMTGDYPVSGLGGMAKPVFDLDSIGLISLLNKMNRGFELRRNGVPHPAERLGQTQFLIGAVTSNFKLREGEVVPQYLKLQKKIECGAQFIINQVGYDARKAHELRVYMDRHAMQHVPLIGNVYVLNPRVARIFHDGKIPGIVLTPPLLELCLKQGKSADHGRAFFHEFAARQMAIYRGLGYRGAYLGGVYDLAAVEKILEIARAFSPDDWKQFAREMRYSRPGEFFYYAENPATGLADPAAHRPVAQPLRSKHVRPVYQISKAVHHVMFTRDRALARWGRRICQNAADASQGPKLLRAVEWVSKMVLYDCRDCGDCSLPEIAYLCPESQCAKNQRNGPCGGTKDGLCEVEGFGECIWLRAYERRKQDGNERELLRHVPVLQNQALRGTSSWANYWRGRDHTATANDHAATGAVKAGSAETRELQLPS